MSYLQATRLSQLRWQVLLRAFGSGLSNANLRIAMCLVIFGRPLESSALSRKRGWAHFGMYLVLNDTSGF